MIKKIIFDLDNTLMEWKDEYIFALENALDKFNLHFSKSKIKEIDSNFSIYEDFSKKYVKKEFIDFINRRCNVNLPIEFVDLVLEEQTKCFEYFDESKLDTLKYLSSKYDLVILSNWFTDVQKKRLANAKIDKYFNIISGGDERELKPSLKAFESVLDGVNPSECIMIGDSIKKDIEPALKLGMKAILITDKQVRKDLRYKRINRLEELKEML